MNQTAMKIPMVNNPDIANETIEQIDTSPDCSRNQTTIPLVEPAAVADESVSRIDSASLFKDVK